jgi:serine/threonine protein kinase
MGAVYLAIDQRLGNTVALKQMLVEGDHFRVAFEREARLLSRLRHPALPVVIDFFTEDGADFLVMQFIPGDDLQSLLDRDNTPFPPDQVMRWADQLLDALEYLHGHSPPIIHRDIKPANLKLTPKGDVVLLDFGLSKGLAETVARASSNRSLYGYTLSYAPLEQVQGSGTDPRSDLYSLAATLYHLLTNFYPPDALTRGMALLNHKPDPLQPADTLNPAVPEAVAGVLHNTLSQDADHRPPSAAAMRRALRLAYQGNLVGAPRAALAGAHPDRTAVGTPELAAMASGGDPVPRAVEGGQRRGPDLLLALAGLERHRQPDRQHLPDGQQLSGRHELEGRLRQQPGQDRKW